MPLLHSAFIRGLVFALAAFAASQGVFVSADEPLRPTFERDIRPIFRAHCFDCHGAAETKEGELDLRLVRFLEKGGDTGPAIAPGKAEESLLLQRVRDGEMPPGDSRLSDEEIETIARWLNAGAPTARPEPEEIGPGLGITPEERDFWAFRPIQPPRVSERSGELAEASIDSLIRAAMPDGLDLSPEADRRTLVRRAYLVLLGLPPAPEESRKWETDGKADWYDRLLDTLLASPHYGERWGRHWLDAAGYADSEGYTVSDAPRPWAWQYRDWVIRAINDDKPFDVFLTEQLAGDQLAGARDGDWTEEQIDLLTATGFLRMAADGTGSGANNAEARNQVMADTLKIVGAGVLGLSVQCAQCHDHRYDPIPQTDYYSLRAIFEPALDWKAWKTPAERQVSLYTEADRAEAARVEEEAKKIGEERSTKQAEYMKQALDKELMKFEEPLRAKLRGAYETPGKDRNEAQKKLLAENPSVNITPGVLYQYLPKAAEELKKYDARIKETRAKKPREFFVRALVEPSNHAPETRLFFRGDAEQPKELTPPAPLTISAPEGQRPIFPGNDPESPVTGRRLAFAKWLTSGKHPLVSRVIVNRVWLHHFGRGIVDTPGDFGKLGAPPSHPELLDYLADQFAREGWSMKKLHRRIMKSQVWRQASASLGPDAAQAETVDSANRFYWRRPLMRLEAEVIRDRMLSVSGQLDTKQFGEPLALQTDDSGQVFVKDGQKRRSLYIQMRRSQPVGMMQAFDAPVMETNCERRSHSTVATQSLVLLNGRFTREQAAALAALAEGRVTEPVASANGKKLPGLPPTPQEAWRYGLGGYDEASQRTVNFQPLSHWTGSAWQGGEKLPDEKTGWVFLNATGGHPDTAERSAIRRWVAEAKGELQIAGTLSHGSPNGDGVRGRVVSSRHGLVGEGAAHKGATEIKVESMAVEAGDTIDFILDCKSSVTSDTFSWPVTLTWTSEGRKQTIASQTSFHGPRPSRELLPAQASFVWNRALSRAPSDTELLAAVAFLADQLNFYDANPNALPKDVGASRQALANLCHALMSSNEFLYVD